MSTFDTSTKEQLASYRSTSLGVNSITSAESGLSIQLAANSSYYINMMVSVESDGDGMQYRLVSTGTTNVQGMAYTDTNLSVTADFTTNSTYTSAGLTKVFMVQGILTTGSASRMYLEVRKDTNTGGPSVIAAGAHLVARRI